MSNVNAVEKEVLEIYEFIHDREKNISSSFFRKLKPLHNESNKVIKRYFFAPLAVLIVLVIVSWFFPEFYALKLVALVMLLVGYVGIIAFQIMEIVADKGTLIQLLKNPLVLYAESLLDSKNSDTELIACFKKYRDKSLSIVAGRLKADQKGMAHKIGILVGALDKIGIIPGLFSLYVAAISHASNKIALIAAVGIFIMYLIALNMHQAWPRFELYINLLSVELDSRKVD